MEKTKTLLALFMAFILLFALSCGGGDKNPGGDGADDGAVPADTLAAEATTENYLDKLPEEDFGGYRFRIIAQHYDARPNFPGEEETGEPMNDSLLRRNRMLEARFNISIENIALQDRGQVRTNINKSVKAQDNAYDLIITSMADGINTLAPGGALYNLNSLGYLGLEEAWWCHSMYENMQVDGRIFYTTGPLSPFYYWTPVVVAYNKNKATEFDIGNINRLVLDNEWTGDRLVELAKDKNRDTDGDGLMTKEDFYGLAHDGGVTGQAFFAAFGQKMTVKDSDSYFRLNLDDEKALAIIDKCARILSDPNYTFNGNMKPFEMYSELPLFKEGKALFLVTTMNNIIERYRDMEDEYGIVPVPKLDASQPGYISLGNPWGPNGIAVPVYCENPERTGLIMETAAYLSYEMVRPAMYDVIIQQKVARDEESQKMLDLIYDNFYFDLNVIHDFGGSSILMRECACGVKENFVSAYEKIRGKAEGDIQKLIAAYLQLG